MSLVAEGVFDRFPTLRVVLRRGRLRLAAGASCGASTRLWRGLRREVPWTRRPPSAYIREHVRLTTAAVRRAARPGGICAGASTSSAPTSCCCSRPTTRTGSSTRAAEAVPPLAGRRRAARDPGRERPPPSTGWEVRRERARRRRAGGTEPHDRLRRPQRAARRRRAARRTCRLTGAIGARRLTYLPTAFRQVRENLGDRSYIGAEYPRPTPRGLARRRVAAGRRAAGAPISTSCASSCSTRWDVELRRPEPAARRRRACSTSSYAARAGARDQRLAGRRVARAASRGCAPRSSSPYEDAARRGGRDRPASRGDRALRPGADARRARSSRSGAAGTGRSTRPASGTGCRSASTSAAAGGHPITGAGCPSFYIEDARRRWPTAFQAQVDEPASARASSSASRALHVVLIEGGFAWLPPLMWRLDRAWRKLARRGAATSTGCRPS